MENEFQRLYAVVLFHPATAARYLLLYNTRLCLCNTYRALAIIWPYVRRKREKTSRKPSKHAHAYKSVHFRTIPSSPYTHALARTPSTQLFISLSSYFPSFSRFPLLSRGRVVVSSRRLELAAKRNSSRVAHTQTSSRSRRGFLFIPCASICTRPPCAYCRATAMVYIGTSAARFHCEVTERESLCIRAASSIREREGK